MADITKTLKPTRVVKGNTFKITIPMQQIKGYDSANNPILTDVDLTGYEADTSVTLHSMYGKTVKDFTISGINISFTVDGDLNNGQYDIEVKTVKNGQKLRMDLKNAFRIVNYNEDADLPSGTEFGVDTYTLQPQIVFAVGKDGDSAYQIAVPNLTIGGDIVSYDPRGTLYADLSTATAATINAIRTAFQVQKLLERDARGGTRYTEIIRSHFGVVSPDSRLQRPEYLGGSSVPVNIAPVAQTSASAISGSATPQGNLSAIGTLLSKSGFTQPFTEHGVIIGLANVRADLNYQQGMRRMWSRRTRYDFYFPAFANLGEQAVLSKEIYCTGDVADDDVFGYQERWAEYRYHPALITGRFRSTVASTLDSWHLAQKFSSRPLLNGAFINEDPPIARVSAVNTALTNQFIFDSFFNIKMARPMPMYSVPGSIDHF